MPNQIAAPIPITPQRRAVRIITSEDLAAGLQGSSTPVRGIRENDYTVPAPPPPSPINFPNRNLSPMKH